MERLYQPDFTCIFGEEFGDAFSFKKIDSLIWPIFSDINFSNNLRDLLKLKDDQGNPLFYIRKLNIADLKIEMNCSDISLGLIQGMNTGKPYGISNLDVIEAVKKEPTIFKGIPSFDLSQAIANESIINELKAIQDEIPVCGIALYPSLTKLDLKTHNNQQLNKLMKYCEQSSLFVKLDLGNFKIPHNLPQFVALERIESFLSTYCNNYIILSGFNVTGMLEWIIHQFKKYTKLWIELDPRSIGGLTPTDVFSKLFRIHGFIQNFWHRISVGSAAPILEISQMVRGFIEATEKLNFAQKNLLRTWTFRNINRLNYSLFKSLNKPINTFLKIKESSEKSYKNQVIITYVIQLRSYSITQLIFLTNIIKNIYEKTLKKYSALNDGELFLRSYHTTTTLIINEHEIGNYLDLHYYFAEQSLQDNSDLFHTVQARENRPDFNQFDHRIASSHGSKQIIIPIRNKRLDLGSRENFYLLVTFGPRTLDLLIQIKLLKEN